MTEETQSPTTPQHQDDPWTPMRLVVLGVVTLAVAFTIINFIAETGLR